LAQGIKATESYDEGQRYYRSGQKDLAVKQFQEAVNVARDKKKICSVQGVYYLYWLGRCLLEMNRYDESVIVLEECCKLMNSLGSARFGDDCNDFQHVLGKVLRETNPKAGVLLLEDLLKKISAGTEFYCDVSETLCQCCINTGNFARAVVVGEVALSTRYNKLGQKGTRSVVELCMRLNGALIEIKRYDRAVDVLLDLFQNSEYQSELGGTETHAIVADNMAESLEALGRSEEAVFYYDMAIQCLPRGCEKYARQLYRLGVALVGVRNLDRAECALTESLELLEQLRSPSGDIVAALQQLARVSILKCEVGGAQRFMDRALQQMEQLCGKSIKSFGVREFCTALQACELSWNVNRSCRFVLNMGMLMFLTGANAAEWAEVGKALSLLVDQSDKDLISEVSDLAKKISGVAESPVLGKNNMQKSILASAVSKSPGKVPSKGISPSSATPAKKPPRAVTSDSRVVESADCDSECIGQWQKMIRIARSDEETDRFAKRLVVTQLEKNLLTEGDIDSLLKSKFPSSVAELGRRLVVLKEVDMEAFEIELTQFKATSISSSTQPFSPQFSKPKLPPPPSPPAKRTSASSKDAISSVTAVKGSPGLMKKPVPPARPVSGNAGKVVKSVSLRDELLAALQKSSSAESVALIQQIKDGHTEVMLQQSQKLLTNLSMAVGVLNSASGFMARFSDAMGPF
jgi:tetratricopeptide (TPR) repeat protein